MIFLTTTSFSYNGRVYIALALKANMKAPRYQNMEPIFYDIVVLYYIVYGHTCETPLYNNIRYIHVVMCVNAM